MALSHSAIPNACRFISFVVFVTIVGCSRTEPTIDPPKKSVLRVPLLMSDDVATVISKAASNYGGREGFARWRCGNVRFKTFGGEGDGRFEATIEETFDLPRHFKRVTVIGSDAFTKTMTWVTNDREGWIRWAHEPVAKPIPEGWPEKDRNEIGRAFDFLGMVERGTYIRDAGEEKIGNETVRVVRIGNNAGPPHELFFQTSNGLLIKSKMLAPDSDPNNPTYFEATFSDYRTVDGFQIPFRIHGQHLRKTLLDVTILAVEFFEKVDPRKFAKP